MAVKRSAVRKLGGFDPALDLGPELPGGGDLDIFWRVLDAGQEIVYDPLVVARHEHRHEYAAAARQITEHNRSAVAFLTKALAEARGARKLSIAAFLLWRLGKPGIRLVRRARGRDPLPAATLLRLWASCWLGLLAYPRAVRIAARREARGG
jgi:GT2 family glycosyltransferase